jgi:pilus assembly protein Flp/PilA
MKILKKLWKEEEGQDLVEYGLLIVLVGLFCVTAMKGLANAISDAFSNAANGLTTAS